MSRTLLIMLLALGWTLPAMGLDEPTISVTGSAKISVRSDQVVLRTSVESRSAQLAGAKEAISEAKAKAELLVSELGAKLSGVQSIHDSTSDLSFVTSVIPVIDAFGDASSAPPLAAGEIQIEANVSVVFRMSETDFD